MAHKKRTDVKHWAPVSGTCCVCAVKFSTRLQLIAHLSDSRPKGGKPPCRASLGRYKAIDNGDVVRMDELDRQARREAHVWVGVSLGLQALRTRGPPVTKRIDPRNGGLPLSSLYLCSSLVPCHRRSTGVIDDVVRLLLLFFLARWISSCVERHTLSTLKVMSGKKKSWLSSFCEPCVLSACSL